MHGVACWDQGREDGHGRGGACARSPTHVNYFIPSLCMLIDGRCVCVCVCVCVVLAYTQLFAALSAGSGWTGATQNTFGEVLHLYDAWL
jgi:hypothetical protein